MQTLIPRGNLRCGPMSDHASSTESSIGHLLTKRAAVASPRRPKMLLAVISLTGCLVLACSPSADSTFRDGDVLGFHADTPPSTAGDVIVPAGPTDGEVPADPLAPEIPMEDEVLVEDGDALVEDGDALVEDSDALVEDPDVSPDQTHDPIAPRTPDNKLIIPWVECTAPWLQVSKVWPDAEGVVPGLTLKDYCLRGLEYWANVTDVAIVTTHPEYLEGTYEYFMTHKPANMRIVGGVSTYTLPGGTPNDTRPYDFADAAGWRFIADEARHIASVTGINIVALENQTALAPWHLGEHPIDFNKLRQSLGALRSTGIRFMWYLPSIQKTSPVFPDRQQKSIEFIQAVSAALPDCGFIIGYMGYKDWILNGDTQATRRQMMRDMLGPDRLLDYMFATADGYWYWTDGRQRYCHNAVDALEEINNLSDAGWVCVYPGVTNWITIGRQFAELMADTRQ